MTESQRDLLARLSKAADDTAWSVIHDTLIVAGIYWDCGACGVWTNTEDDAACDECGASREGGSFTA